MERVTGTSHVPAFLAKLWRIVDEPSTNDLICWNTSGKSFIIQNQSKFARELLPLYYKHNNMASFIRQLNMYGFHKVLSVEQGGLRIDRDEMEFAHPYFVQGNEDALEFIKRKISTSKIEELKSRPESLNKVLIDVRQMKGRQEAMDTKLVAVKRENEALWRELSQLRQKHAKQQQIVSKLLQFLVSMMSSQSHRISFKRRMPLMLNDVEGNTKPAKLSRPTKTEEPVGESSNGAVIHEVFESEEPMIILNVPEDGRNEEQPQGEHYTSAQLLKVEDLLNTAVTNTIGKIMEGQGTSPKVIEVSPGVPHNEETVNNNEEDSPYVTDLLSIQTMDSSSESPNPPMETQESSMNDEMGTGTDIVPLLEDTLQLSRTTEPDSSSKAVVKPKVILPDGLDGHLDEVQLGLDSLKDLLQGSAYNIDHSTLSGVGTTDLNPMNYNYTIDSDILRQLFGVHENDLPLFEFSKVDDNKEKEAPLGLTLGEGTDLVGGSGSDLVSYNPCLFELAEDDAHFFENPGENLFLDDELDMMLTTDRNKLNGGLSS